MKKLFVAAFTVLISLALPALATDPSQVYNFGGTSSFGGNGFVNSAGGDFTGALQKSGYGSNNTVLNTSGTPCGAPDCNGDNESNFKFQGNAGEHIALEGVVNGVLPDTDTVLTNGVNGGAQIVFWANTPETNTTFGIGSAFQAEGAGVGRFSGSDGTVAIDQWGGGGTNLNMAVEGCLAGDISCQQSTQSGNVYAYDGVNVAVQVASDQAGVPIGAINSGQATSGATLSFFKDQ